jgi:hypothetical protein
MLLPGMNPAGVPGNRKKMSLAERVKNPFVRPQKKYATFFLRLISPVLGESPIKFVSWLYRRKK